MTQRRKDQAARRTRHRGMPQPWLDNRARLIWRRGREALIFWHFSAPSITIPANPTAELL